LPSQSDEHSEAFTETFDVKMTVDDFNRMITTAVDEVITEVLGSVIMDPIASYLHTYLGIINEMPGRVDLLFASLRGVFGSGGDILCAMIVARISKNAGLNSATLSGQSPEEKFEETKKKLLKT